MFQPELGQMMRAGGWNDIPADHLTDGICVIADAIRALRGDQGSLASNYGEDEYLSRVFNMRPYCWCDGDTHPEGCPPNFETTMPDGTPLVVDWYKHAGRSISMNQPVPRLTWARIVHRCLGAVLS